MSDSLVILNKNMTNDFLKLGFAFIISRQIIQSFQKPGIIMKTPQDKWVRESILTLMGVFIWYTFLSTWTSNFAKSVNLSPKLESALMSAMYMTTVVMASVMIAGVPFTDSKNLPVIDLIGNLRHYGVIFAIVFGYEAFGSDMVRNLIGTQTNNYKAQEVISTLILYSGLFYGYSTFIGVKPEVKMQTDHGGLSIPFGIGLAMYTILFE
jgi:hypothetical protein